MKATVVCGLLGSGKTTFLVEALRNTKERVAVLVNDFAQAGIDGEIVSASGVPTIELPSGCVCCTLRFDLVTTLKRIISENEPDHIMVEPSGVASPSGVLEALAEAGINRSSVTGILDATEFLDMYESGMYGRFLLDQVTQADVLLVNKSDLASRALLDQTLSLVSSLNPGAVLLPTVRARVEDPFNLPASTMGIFLGSPADLPSFESFSTGLPEQVSLDGLLRFFEELKQGAYGTVMRAKALIMHNAEGFRVDLASGRVEHSGLSQLVESGRMVVLGRGLDTDKMNRAMLQVADT